ncbi:MAG: RNase H family protein, partial [Verrucomicrobiota bacterium]|nr:RNase H family protein [Verrucomicrobiota bacterium]
MHTVSDTLTPKSACSSASLPVASTSSTSVASWDIYTDGSKRSGKASAGWGVVIYTDSQKVAHLELFGRVVSPGAIADRPSLASFAIGAEEDTNNTGELSALVETFLWLQSILSPNTSVSSTSSSLYDTKSATIWTDSEYCLGLLTLSKNGRAWKSNPTLNIKLVQRARKELLGLRKSGFIVNLRYVPAHANIAGNERADYLAKRGGTGEICLVGRWASLHSMEASISSSSEATAGFPAPG